MPFGSFVNLVPPAVFLVLHLAAFVVGTYFAFRAFGVGAPTLGWAFTLYAVAEAVYMAYNLDAAVFLFAHTLAEALDFAAFVLVFTGAVRRLRTAHPAPAAQIESSSPSGAP